MNIKNLVLFSCFLIPFFVSQSVQSQDIQSKIWVPGLNQDMKSSSLDTVTEEEKITIANLSLDELQALIKKYDSMKAAPDAHIGYTLGIIFQKDDWLAAIDPLLEIYSSSHGGAKEELVESLACLCTTKEMPPQLIDKIQDTFLADLEKGTAINGSLRARLVRGLYQSVNRLFLMPREKEALRKKGIDPDAPLRGTDKIVPALIKALDDESVSVRMNAVSGLRVSGDTSIEDAAILPALEARKKIEQNQFVNNALDDTINKFQKKAAALADKKENN